MPGQAEEEVHQLAYIQKHLPSLLSLLAETSEEGENSTKVQSVILIRTPWLKNKESSWSVRCILVVGALVVREQTVSRTE
jgi:hypothetical protein